MLCFYVAEGSQEDVNSLLHFIIMVPMLHTLAVVTAFWCMIYSIDKLLNTYSPYKLQYLNCQDHFGIAISFANLRCYTSRFNNLFKLWGKFSRSLARLWFNIGVIVGLLLMLTSVVILIYALYQELAGDSKEEQVLTPIMPGVNLPWSEVLYYFLTLVVCGIVHEVGHALAAVTEQVRINGFGIFLLFIYPGAFVDLHSDHLTVISPKRQLRIYCAGVWHNVILSLCMFLFLLSLPYLLLPFYTSGHGAVVVSVNKDSPLHDKLLPGTAIIQFDSCIVDVSKDWYTCIQDIGLHSQTGYCIPSALLESHPLLSLNKTKHLKDGNGIDCCSHDTQSDICFSVVTLTKNNRAKSNQYEKKYICLTARQIISDVECHTNDECNIITRDQACVIPAIGSYSHLVKIKHTGTGDPVIFLGDLRSLLYSVKVTDFLPSSKSLPLWLPSMLHTIAIYIISISSALALLNMLPAYTLDGQWALGALLESLWPEYPHRNKILNGILTCGSILLVLNIILAIWILINW